ncbi:hypothetical protein [Streptomyces cinereoruber]|uniref:hypothetical protein n=1 Tax=Streptomyces cinereoruber TaxID=67260 RepID=UPI003C2FCB81
MPSNQPRQDLKKDIHTALDRNSEYDLPELVTVAVLQAVLPHLEAAYKRGEIAAKLRQGSRLVVKNEELRRENRRLKEKSE